MRARADAFLERAQGSLSHILIRQAVAVVVNTVAVLRRDVSTLPAGIRQAAAAPFTAAQFTVAWHFALAVVSTLWAGPTTVHIGFIPVPDVVGAGGRRTDAIDAGFRLAIGMGPAVFAYAATRTIRSTAIHVGFLAIDMFVETLLGTGAQTFSAERGSTIRRAAANLAVKTLLRTSAATIEVGLRFVSDSVPAVRGLLALPFHAGLIE